jgi:5'-nucleotidase
MRILLTNDDGIDAPGLEALHKAAVELGDPVVIAPVARLSGCSHRVTTDEPIRLKERGPGRFAIEGTPADCVRIGLHGVAPDSAWVLAGINHGGNLGADVWHSGTVAAVREAVLHGLPGIAVSHFRRKGQEYNWHEAARWAVLVLRDLITKPRQEGVFWNVNLPHLQSGEPMPEVIHCPLDPTPLPVRFHQESELFHYNGDYHERRRRPGNDVDVCFRGSIAVTELKLF